MRSFHTISALLALLSSPAFAFTCPAKGGPEWREYTTEHFRVDTDLSGVKVDILIKDLETMRSLLVRGLFGDEVDIPGRMRVVALASPSDFRMLAGSEMISAYFMTNSSGDAVIVLPVEGLKASEELVAHEIAHHLSRYQFPEQPAWFAEGLAAFLQTVARRDEQRQTEQWSHVVRGGSTAGGAVGLMPSDYTAAFRANQQPVPARELFEWRGGESLGDPGRYHVSSWLLYHWLWNQRGKQLAEYQKRLADGDEPAAVWKSVFPEYDPVRPAGLAALDDEIRKYGKSARYAFYKVNATASFKTADAPLSSAQVHLLLVQARLRWPESREAMIRAELEEALREDPQNVEVIVERARLNRAEPDVTRLRAIANARKTDFRAWLAVGDWTNDGIEERLAYQKAAALNPQSADAQLGAARALAAAGQAREAVGFANRAVDLAPWNPRAVETLAISAHGTGKCAAALQLQRRAVRMFGDDEQAVAEAKKRLADFQASCKPPAQ
jgi:tetratricopeptide (TPR) repeat protein